MLNKNKQFQRAHGKIDVKIINNQVNKFYQSGSAKVFYPKCYNEFNELVLVNTAGGITGGDLFIYNIDIQKSKIFVTTQTAERAYKGYENSGQIKVNLSIDSDSSLFWIPQELILFDNCNLNRKIDVNLNIDSNFLLSETTIFGRTAMNENLEKGFFFDNWRIHVKDKLIHAEALSLSGDIKNILSGLATAQNNVSICNIFLYGKDFLKNELQLIKTIESFDMNYIAYSSWNDKMLIRIISKDAYYLKNIQKKILLCVSNNTIPKVWNS
jgi:urease accessory protein